MIINMWSGPRNLSTALMRSFENRKDTNVWDEPLYAYYLKNTKLNHPLAKKIINKYKTNIDDLIKDMTTKKDHLKILYLKQMTHHLINKTSIDWIKKTKNCLLIRDPKKVINSYLKKNEIKTLDDIGFESQYKIFRYLNKNKLKIIVINADDLIFNSEKTIKNLCNNLKIEFTNNMLKWPKGKRKTDGIWGEVWYKKVINSTTFNSDYINKEIKIPSKYNSLLNEANQIYKELNLYNLNNNY